MKLKKKGLLLGALLALSVSAFAVEALIRWQMQEVTVAGNTQVGPVQSLILQAIIVNNVAVTSGNNANLSIYDSATGQSYTAGVVRRFNFSVPQSISLTPSSWVIPVQGVYFQNGIVVESGANTVDATYVYVPAN